MGYYIMQASPNEDLYIQMSNNIDLPLRLGTLGEWNNLIDSMLGEEKEAYEGMMERMKRYGTSSWSGGGAWDSDITLVGKGHPDGHEYWSLPRGSVSDFFNEYRACEDLEDRASWHILISKYCSPLED